MLPIIEVKDLHKSFLGNHILKGVNFKLEPGKLVSIIGRSGCGKTTFLRCLNCLEILDSGSISIAGITLFRKENDKSSNKEVTQAANQIRTKVGMPFQSASDEGMLDEDFQIKAHALRTRVGMLFQGLNLFPNLTVIENIIKAPVIVKGVPTEKAREDGIKILEKVGMSRFVDRLPYQLSGGQAQRVAIARALAMQPQVMLYDEPTSALDPELIEEVTEVMSNLNKDGMTQLVVTHSMSFAKNASDYVVYFHEGNIAEMGTPEEIFSNPKDKRTAEYLKIFRD